MSLVNTQLFYCSPAAYREGALPIGNGRIGAMIFGGRNTDGKADASGRMGWGKWCDDNGIFLVAPGLKNDNYWEPKAWSGKALQKALRQLKRKYNICTDKILYYGYSAGSQAGNLLVLRRFVTEIRRKTRKTEIQN